MDGWMKGRQDTLFQFDHGLHGLLDRGLLVDSVAMEQSK
jgi:hypothetical protein